MPFGVFKGGARVALGETNNILGDELIVGRGPGATPQVKVFTDASHKRAVSDEPVLKSSNAYAAAYNEGFLITFNPEEVAQHSVFDGLDVSGEWRLSITGDSGGDVGDLFGWGLYFDFGA